MEKLYTKEDLTEIKRRLDAGGYFHTYDEQYVRELLRNLDHSQNVVEKQTYIIDQYSARERLRGEALESTGDAMVLPCCKEELPAPLGGVATAECPKCECIFTPSIIVEYNELIRRTP
jgi:hypothetical protein